MCLRAKHFGQGKLSRLQHLTSAVYAYRRVAAGPKCLKIKGQQDASTRCEALVWSCSFPQVLEGVIPPQHLSPLSD